MADADTRVTIEQLYAAVAGGIASAFPALRTVEFDREDESESIATPACLLSLVEFEPAEDRDAGTGQWPTLARFEARLVISSRPSDSAREVRKLAAAVATWLNLRRWGLDAPGDECRVIAVEPDEFAPNLDRFHVWRVEWAQLVMLGEPVWLGGSIPEALYSFVPIVGEPHEADYQRVDGEPRA